MIRKLVLSLTAVLVFSAVPQMARAEGVDANGWVGGILGLHIPDYEDTSARMAYGVTGGAKLGTEFGLGGYYLNSAKKETINGASVDFDYSMYGLEGTYHFEGEAAVFTLGFVGMTTVDVGMLDIKPMHWGLVAGYNHWLTDQFSIGGEASFFNVAGGDEVVSGATISVDSFNIIAFQASAKFWF